MAHRYEEKRKGRGTLAAVLIAISLLVIFALSIAIVPAGHRGVLTTFGDVEEGFVLDEGLHFKQPIAQDVIMMEVRTQKYESEATAASKDLQDTRTTVALNFHIVPDRTNEIYQTIGRGYADRFILPAIQEVVKASTAKFDAEELITKRPIVKDDIESGLKERLEGRGIVLETLSITDFRFSAQFTAAIEAKVEAEQEALKAENILRRIEVEAKQRAVEGQGEAAKIREVESALIDSPNYIKWLATTKWDGILPKVTGGATPFVSIPIDDGQ